MSRVAALFTVLLAVFLVAPALAQDEEAPTPSEVATEFAKEFKKTNGVDLLKDKQAIQRLKDASEKAKIELSGTPTTQISIPFITQGDDGPLHLEMDLSRSQFESLIDDLVEKTVTRVVETIDDRYTIAPLSVLVDPSRAARILGLEPGRSFSPKVVYVYKKQLEEAELILVNKCDLIDEEQQARIEEALRREFPQAEVLRCSAKEGSPIFLRWWSGKRRLKGRPRQTINATGMAARVMTEG